MRLPLESFTVERFRGVRDLELRDLGRFNLLVGRNNSGKTSVLEALRIFSAPLDPWNWLNTAWQREPLGGSGFTVIERLCWLFPHTAGRDRETPYDGTVRLLGSGRVPLREVTARYLEVRGTISNSQMTMTEEFTAESLERRGAQIDLLLKQRQLDLFDGDEARGSFTLWEGERFERPRERVQLGTAFRYIHQPDHWIQTVRLYSDAKLAGLDGAAIDLLRKIEPTIEGVELLVPPQGNPGAPRVYLRDKHAGLSPLSSYGDGVRRALLFALAIPSVAGGVLLIDELETAIHVSALGHVFRWLLDACTKHDVQVFATTHSLEALDAILAVDPTPEEDIVAYRLEREGEQTTARRYGEDLLKRIRYERGLDVR
ncbi:AAA family ATPase [Polyangium sorediatum]|uniref:AAA family ATPase n=1 Tax=Polyangium sorediatum TaxID=889274 RepID=A0ABT6NZV9_9BACT|nr:ATP-binding protein [Polyangium sorediatum]MDI1433881.1 AAA family ATPase [Polyangium sorediatum]